MLTGRTACLFALDELKHRAEHGWGDARPPEPARFQERVTHAGGEVLQRQSIGEQGAVDVRETRQQVTQILVAFAGRGVEHTKQ